ncbi:MAG: M24 family metallopeptidase [Endomicrobium sp.]|jgi:Xaa-Pro aminopeptidase|nr:M24 family metallopeptidase [Endomicrobium sp.]
MKEKILKLFKKYQVESILFTNTKEIFYLTMAKFDGFWILSMENKTYIIHQKMIENQIKEYFFNSNQIKTIPYIFVTTELPLYKSVLEILKKNKIGSLLIDLKYTNALDFTLINENFKKMGVNFIKKVGVLDNMRVVKTTFEIENIKMACKIVSETCNVIKNELKVGLTEIDIHYRVLELFAKKQVSESFSPIIASGINSADPHHISSSKKIIENDIIMIDIGCLYNGYCSDLTRTYFLGRPNAGRKAVWNTVKNAQDTILKKIKSGMPISYSDKVVRNVISASGYKKNFIHSTGHGVGTEVHEMPSLSSSAKGVFLANSTVTVEPGIYIKHKFGVRIEDTILVTKNGCTVLTSANY